jgi:hypothetical protein
MGERTGFVIGEGPADPVADVDAAERSCSLRGSGDGKVKQRRNDK